MIASITASQRHFTHTDLPILSEPASHIIDEHTIDTEVWLVSMAKRAHLTELPGLTKACQLLKNQDLSTASNRSNAFWLGLGLRIFWVICTKMKTHSLLRCYIVPRVSNFTPNKSSHLWRWSRRAGTRNPSAGATVRFDREQQALRRPL